MTQILAALGAFMSVAWKWLLLFFGALIILSGIGWFLSPTDALEEADAIVAISGGNTAARTEEAIKVYKDGYAPKLVFSGAAMDKLSPSNARVMRAQAVEQGVEREVIVIDEKSSDTAQNALNTETLLKDLGVKKIILVTSGYHQRRASMEFRAALGDDVVIINHPAPDDEWPRRWYLTPRGWWLAISELVKTGIIWLRITF